MKVRVKSGHKAFVGGALRTAGYVADVPGKTVPFWGEKVEATAKPKAKAKAKAQDDGAVSFNPPSDEGKEGSDNTVTL